MKLFEFIEILQEERVAQAAFLVDGSRIVPCGPMHDTFYLWPLIGDENEEPDWDALDDFARDHAQDGFLTDRGRFLTRQEAKASLREPVRLDSLSKGSLALDSSDMHHSDMTMRESWQRGSSSAPHNIVRKYLTDGCWEMAVALHRMTGLPIYIAGAHHAFVADIVKGVGYDIRGRVPLDQIARGSRAEGAAPEETREEELLDFARIYGRQPCTDGDIRKAKRIAKQYGVLDHLHESEERVKQSAYKFVDTDEVIPTGAIHDYYFLAQHAGVDTSSDDPEVWDELEDWAQQELRSGNLLAGFLTNTGRFLTREEAGHMSGLDHPLYSENAGLIDESDYDHGKALQDTGFWGKQGAGLVFLARSTGRLLIAHRSRSVEQPGTWGSWGGAIDAKEEPEVAAYREATEECGYSGPVQMVPLYVFKDERSGFRYSNFLAVIDEEFQPRLNWESEGSAWIEFGQWPQPLHFGLKALFGDPASVQKIKSLIGLKESVVFAYHGTPNAGFDKFSHATKGIRTGHNPEDVGFHFTSNPDYADAYSASHLITAYEFARQHLGREPKAIDLPKAPGIHPVKLHVKKWFPVKLSKDINSKTIAQAKEAGCDGIIADHGNGTEYVVFEPSQIESIFEAVQQDPAFKSWFGKSKVVDAQGQPLRVYHGTMAGDIGDLHGWTHFGTSASANNRISDIQKLDPMARGHSHATPETEQPALYPVYLRILNPLEINDRGTNDTEDFIEEVERAGVWGPEETAKILTSNDSDQLLQRHLEALGYDGFVYQNQHEGGLSFIPFRKEQIRPALSEGASGDLPRPLKFYNNVTGHRHGQMDGCLYAFNPSAKPKEPNPEIERSTLFARMIPSWMQNEVYGYIQWAEYEGKTNIMYIRTNPDYLRRGVATALLNHLSAEAKRRGTSIDWSSTTKAGGKLRSSYYGSKDLDYQRKRRRNSKGRQLWKQMKKAGVKEGYAGSTFHNDETGGEYSVEKAYEIAKSNPAYLKKNFPIVELEHDLVWWDGDLQHAQGVDTSFPLLVLDIDGHLTVADGLNRLKKARDIEGKKAIDAYVVPNAAIHDAIIEGFVRPNRSSEHDEVLYQLRNDQKSPFLPEWVRNELNNLRDPQTFAQVMSRGKVVNINPNEVKSVGNTGDTWADSNWTPEKRVRVENLFKTNAAIPMPVFLNNTSGEKWLLAGHHRLTYNSEILKRPTPVLHISATALTESVNLNEIHYKDTYPDEFEKFRAKYLKLSKRHQGGDLYVQFTNYADNTLDRTIQQNPDHSDPAGIYGYPLQYVLKNPADIWYGQGAKFLRVLKNTSKKPIDLSNIRWEQAQIILHRMGLGFDDTLMRKARRTFKHKGVNQAALCFLSVVQLDLTATPKKTGWGNPEYPKRSAVEQAALFKKAGYDAIVDESNRAIGVMNAREPEQICFLTRAAFRVVEVFHLRPADDPRKISMSYNDPGDDEALVRKLAAGVAKAIEDKLVGNPETSSLNGWRYFWTAKGRRIQIFIVRPESYHDKPLGAKKHKYDTTTTDHEVNIQVFGEFGQIDEYNQDDKERLSRIVDRVWQRYRAMKAQSVEWKPETRTGWNTARDAKRYFAMANRMRREHGLPPATQEQLDALKARGLNILGESR